MAAEIRQRKPRQSKHLQIVDSDAAILIPDANYIQATRSQLRDIDLDPCSSPKAQAAIAAQRWVDASQARGALAEIWDGRVFLHPHPSQVVARLQVQKLLRDYLAGRISCAVVLSDHPDLLRTEPLLLSFPFVIHLKRCRYWRWLPEQQILEPFFPSRYSVTHYLPRRDTSTFFCDQDIDGFRQRFSAWGRPVLTEDFGDDWQQDALRLSHRWRLPPLLTTSRLNRSEL